MPLSFHRIAYEALDVCNGVEMAAIEAMVDQAALPAGARAFDLGTGNAAVAIRLAERFGLHVEAVEADPGMAELAAERIAMSGVGGRITLRVARSGAVIPALAPADLIAALGSTDSAGLGRAAPVDTFARLRDHLRPGGWLLWGDLTFRGEPPAPLRHIVEITNLYADDAGWRAAAARAGFEIAAAEASPQEVWDRYAATMLAAVDAWLGDHPDAPETPAIRQTAERLRAMFDFGRPWLGFSVYLLRRQD